MRFYFHEDAEAEFDKAVEYYEDIQPGLGLEFAREVYGAIKRVFSSLKHGRPIPRIPAAVWLTAFLLVLYINSSLVWFASLRLPIFDVVQVIG